MVTHENYIKQNAPTVAENCIKNYLWEQKSFSDTIDLFTEYVTEYGFARRKI